MPQAKDPTPIQIPDRVGVSESQRKLALADAIELALQNNLQIEIDRTVIEESQENFFGARGWLDPHFRVSPRVEHRTTPTSSTLIGTDGKLEQDVGTIDAAWNQKLPWWGANVRVALDNSRQSTTNPFDALSPFNAANLGATLTLPFTRNRAIDRSRATLRVTNKQVAFTETQFEASVINVVTAVEEAYWNLVASRQNVAVTSEAVELAREQLARTQRMIDSGTLAPVELAAAEAELERRVDTWYASIGLVTQVENAVKILLTKNSGDGMWDEELVPTEEDTLRPPEFTTVRAAVDLAFSKRPELRQVDLQTETNDIQKQLARNQTRTQVDFVGGVSFAGLSGAVADSSNPFSSVLGDQFVRVNTLSGLHGLSPVEVGEIGGVAQSLVGSYARMWSNLFQGKFPTAFAGVQIDFTARNRAAKAELAKTLVAERRLKLRRDQVGQMITAEVRNALQAIQTARQRIQAAEASARAAQEKLDSEIRLFRNGESTNFLVLTRQNELADSQQRAVVARLDFNKAVARIQKALGTTLQTYNVQLQ
jgi:outer membrane protein TolC